MGGVPHTEPSGDNRVVSVSYKILSPSARRALRGGRKARNEEKRDVRSGQNEGKRDPSGERAPPPVSPSPRRKARGGGY